MNRMISSRELFNANRLRTITLVICDMQVFISPIIKFLIEKKKRTKKEYWGPMTITTLQRMAMSVG